jgi:RNA polymerase sigma-70 factor (ECF subfamily)
MSDGPLEFQSIHAIYRPKIHRYLARLVGDLEAEDLTQETFVKVSRALAYFRGESTVSAWLYRIATNVALDSRRSPASRRIAVASLSEDSGEDAEAEIEDRDAWTGEKKLSIERALVRKEMNECILGFVERLPQNYRTVLTLSELEGLKNNEIAEILGVTLDTVKIRLHRARARLKEQLETHCELDWLEEIPCRVI